MVKEILNYLIEGPRIPHSEEVARADKRAFLLLLLFKPWRSNDDLKVGNQSWNDALDEFQNICGIIESKVYE
jgi:hypothetical protein